MRLLLIIGLMWLAVIQVESIQVRENMEKMAETTKLKRYLNHGYETSSPCPPFYPHFDMPKPRMHLMRPYGSPAYPKPVYGPPVQHHNVQFINQPSETYIKQPTVQYAKPHVSQPIYQQHQQPIIHVQPINKLQQNYWQSAPQSYEKPQHAYAPNYHVPMFLPTTQKDWIKPVNYHAAEANRLNNPGIIYKDEPQNCPPCAANKISHQHIHQQISAPQIIQLQPTYAKPIIHQAPVQPALHYLPAPLQSPIVKHHEHIEPCDK